MDAYDYAKSKESSDLERRFVDFVVRDDEEKWKKALDRIANLEQQLREAEVQRDRLRECLKRLEWCSPKDFCPACDRVNPEEAAKHVFDPGPSDHAPDCWLRRELEGE